MAMKMPSRQYSKKLIFNVVVVVLLGWLILFFWTMTLWVRFGFDDASQRLYQLSTQQHAAIVQFNDASIAERLNAVLMTLPTENVSNKVSELNHSIRLALPANPLIESSELNRITADALRFAKQVWMFIVITSHIMLIKLTILMAAIPLFVLAMTAGLIDGLNQRAIRTASLGRESSYVFHQLNRLFKRGLIVLLGLWLAIPVSITPELMLVPVSVLLSVMVSVTASRFKKYL
jgi:integrating conjugative element membrane protein (TIGR03747 family)